MVELGPSYWKYIVSFVVLILVHVAKSFLGDHHDQRKPGPRRTVRLKAMFPALAHPSRSADMANHWGPKDACIQEIYSNVRPARRVGRLTDGSSRKASFASALHTSYGHGPRPLGAAARGQAFKIKTVSLHRPCHIVTSPNPYRHPRTHPPHLAHTCTRYPA